MSDSLENVPLHTICKEAEHLTRELIDHLDRNLIPRTKEIQNLVRPDSPFNSRGNQVKDITVRSQMSTLLESQEFTEQLFAKTRHNLEAIGRALSESND